MSAASKNVVVGAVLKYDWPKLREFVVSLKNTGYEGRIVFLCSQVGAQTLDTLREQGVETYPISYPGRTTFNRFTRLWPLVGMCRTLRLPSGLLNRIAARVTNFQTARFFHYRTFLAMHCDPAAKVLVTDVRDVVFQDDPFRGLEGRPHVLQSFCEGRGGCPIGDSGYEKEVGCTGQWIKEARGPSVFEALRDKNILCSGTIIGTGAELSQYFGLLCREICRAKAITSGGVDQGIHNITWYENPSAVMETVPNGAGNVFTAGILSEDEIARDSDGRVLRDDGTPAPVLHQYDRHPALNGALLERLGLSDGAMAEASLRK